MAEEKVATHFFSVPIGEVPVMYTGRFVSVELGKPAYAPGEEIKMWVDIEVARTAQWIDIFWHSIIRAYNSVGELLTEVTISHVAIPGVFDRETYDEDIYLGSQPVEGLSGRLELWCGGSPDVLVATAEFGVPTKEVVPVERPWLPWAIAGGIVLLTGAGILIATK